MHTIGGYIMRKIVITLMTLIVVTISFTLLGQNNNQVDSTIEEQDFKTANIVNAEFNIANKEKIKLIKQEKEKTLVTNNNPKNTSHQVKKNETQQAKPVVKKEVTQTKQKTANSQSENIVQASNENEGKTMYVTATAYTANCEGCSGITYTGINLINNPNMKVIAVDPNVIPLGSKVWVEGYGTAIAGDIGGAIKGNRIDVFIPNQQDAERFGIQQLRIKILN